MTSKNADPDLFPALPQPVSVDGVREETYPAPRFPHGSGKAAIVRVLAQGGSVILVVETVNPSVTVTNAALELRAHLEQIENGPIHVIEHWPADEGCDRAEHYDRVAVRNGQVLWDRLYPTSRLHPRHDEYNTFYERLTATLRGAGTR